MVALGFSKLPADAMHEAAKETTLFTVVIIRIVGLLAIELITIRRDRNEKDVQAAVYRLIGRGTRGGASTGSAGRPASIHAVVISDATPVMACENRFSMIGPVFSNMCVK